jgi:hypothetical protein
MENEDSTFFFWIRTTSSNTLQQQKTSWKKNAKYIIKRMTVAIKICGMDNIWVFLLRKVLYFFLKNNCAICGWKRKIIKNHYSLARRLEIPFPVYKPEECLVFNKVFKMLASPIALVCILISMFYPCENVITERTEKINFNVTFKNYFPCTIRLHDCFPPILFARVALVSPYLVKKANSLLWISFSSLEDTI